MTKARGWPEGLNFLKTELATGLTFSKLALDSHDTSTIERNIGNARTAYETAFKLRDKVLLSSADFAELDALFKQLRAQLVKLGQDIYACRMRFSSDDPIPGEAKRKAHAGFQGTSMRERNAREF